MFHGPWECVLCVPFIFAISSEWSQWLLCITLEKLKDMNIFLAHSIEKAQTEMAGLLSEANILWWGVDVICGELVTNNRNKSIKQVFFY